MLILTSVLLFCTFAIRKSAAQIIAKTNNGDIEGIAEKTNSGKIYYAYYTIPYAKPPLGVLRFQAPEPSDPWNTTHNGTVENSNVCYQLSYDFPQENEDCLHLNVFSPVNSASSPSKKKLPVLVNFHAGSFTSGAGLVAPITVMGGISPKYFLEEDIVFVSLNYRLGIFGFLSTGDSVIPGNAGVKDQMLALKWVQKNIAAFGGDPDKVTICGQSAGAASVGYHIFNVEAKGLFSAGILESGSPLEPWSYQRNQTEISFMVGSFIDSRFKTSRDSKELLKILQAADAKALDDAATNYTILDEEQPDGLYINPVHRGFQFAPVIETNKNNSLISDNQYEILASGNFNIVPVLMGVSSEEGLINIVLSIDNDLKAYDNTTGYLVPQDLHINRTTNKATWNKLGELIKQEYSPLSTFVNNKLGGIHYFTDHDFIRGSTKFAEIYAKHSDVYYYKFSYTGGGLGANPWNANNVYPGSGNVSHVGEWGYLYSGLPICSFSQSDQLIHRRLVRFWTNFVKYHNPTPSADKLCDNTVWTKVSTGTFEYLNIGNFTQTDLIMMPGKPNPERMAFWDKIYKVYGIRPFDTY